MHCLSEDTLAALAAAAFPACQLEEIDAHLDSCAACRRLVAAVTASDSTPVDVPWHREEPGLPIGAGTRIGRYEVRGVLGAGGMGVVYSARDPELERNVAVKLLHDHRRTSLLLGEARAMARIAHPNAVQIYDLGEHGARAFIAMELVEGRTLGAWLAESPRPRRQIVAAFAAAGRGLSAAHEAGLLHRDFKPDNVFVSRCGRVKVGDFGLARPAEHATSDHVSGTPSYLAPEVLAGSPPAAASDQFAFCVSLWEGLAGQRPFAGRTAWALFQEARAGKARGASRIPSRLRKALLRGLAADPAARHPSMAVLLRELEPPAPRFRHAAVIAMLAALAALAVAFARPTPLRAAPPPAETRGCLRRADSAKAG